MNALKKILLATVMPAFALALSACRPMYGETVTGSQTTYELASVDIEPIPGRVGQVIRNELIFLFTGGNRPQEPMYKLDVVYRASVLGVLFKRSDDASGKIYSIDATYTLRDQSGKTVLTTGHSHARAGFDKLTSTYANVRAKRDAENRAAKDIARDLNTRIAAYLSSNH